MADDVSLIDKIYAVSVEPERIDELVDLWETRLRESGAEGAKRLDPFAGGGFDAHFQRAEDVFDRVGAARDNELRSLVDKMRTAAMVVAPPNLVIAANQTARRLFAAVPHMPMTGARSGPGVIDGVIAGIEMAAGNPASAGVFLQLDLPERQRPLLVHIRALPSPNARARQVLIRADEPVWSVGVEAVLRQTFRLSAAEIELVAAISRGGTVAEIAETSGRKEGTLRSQLHAVLGKIGARSQADLLRLVFMLADAPLETARSRKPLGSTLLAAGDARIETATLPDGRRLDHLVTGAEDGRPFLSLMSNIGASRWHPEAEKALADAGLRLVTPIRAGFGFSDPPPPGFPIHEVAARDSLALMDHLGMQSAVIVAPVDDIRIALMMARMEPGRVKAIIATGAGFPVRTPEQYGRMHSMTRFFRLNARHAPIVIRFALKALRSLVRLRGVDPFIRGTLRHAPADLAVYEDPEVRQAISAGFQFLMGDGVSCEAAFTAETVSFLSDWPEELGDVGCPVTLFHGEQDQNAPFETARDYAATYPNWRMVSFPDQGQLVAHGKWRELVELVSVAV